MAIDGEYKRRAQFVFVIAICQMQRFVCIILRHVGYLDGLEPIL